MKKRLIFCAALFLAAVADTFACTNLIVGKNASTDGSTIVSYSADSYGPVSYTHLTLPTNSLV